MKAISVKCLGCCVTRDAIDYDCESKGFGNAKYQVVRYLNFVSPYTMISGNKLHLTIDELLNNNSKTAKYRARCLVLDAEKKGIEYMREVQDADWLFLDVGNVRCRTVEWREKGVILTYGKALMEQIAYINNKLQSYNPQIAFPWERNLDQDIEIFRKILSSVAEGFNPAQIILLKFYAVFDYIALNGCIKKFESQKNNISSKWNNLFDIYNKIVEDLFPECHVIPFPDNVIADAGNRWGLEALHYSNIYYEYAEKCIDIITQKLERSEENKQIDFLKQLYTEKFNTLRAKAAQKSTALDRDKWKSYSTSFKTLINNDLTNYNENTQRNICHAILSKGYQHIAIYGDTEITKVLCRVLNGSDISIDYIVENSSKPINGIKTINRSDTVYPNCDVMLVADIYYYKKIKAKLEKMKVPFPFYNAAEFIQSLPASDGDGLGKIKKAIADPNKQLADCVQKEESATLTAARDSAKEDVQAIKKSVSYKIGRFITYFPRKIRDVLKPKKH